MSTAIVVLSEKLRRPPSRGLTRERLIQPIVSATAPPTALVTALAGAGKTTLLAQVAERLGASVAWYRATAGDRSGEALVAHLVQGLAAADCIMPGRIEHVDDLLAAVDRTRVPCAVLLDDLHEIRGTPAEAVLEHFVQLRPPHVRVVMGSRSPPLFNLPRLRVSGEIVEIGNEDLRFRSWEVEQLLLDVYGEPLPPEPVAALTRKIGGWAAGLQLFHLATSHKSASERCQAVAELDGRSHLIRPYLARNVLAELSDEKRRFLTRTCTLGLMSSARCDRLLGTTRSAELLAELEEAQLFTTSDDDGMSYRYHAVLQVYLESALAEELGPRLAREAYAHSAALLEADGCSHDALRAYARAEDWSAVARLLCRSGRSPTAAVTWEDLVPPDLRHGDPWFAMADARRQLRSGLVDAALTTYRHAAALLDDPAFQDQCLRERRLAAAWALDPGPTPGRSEQSKHWHWSLLVRTATRRTSREQPRSCHGPVETGDRLADGLCSLLAGDLTAAADELQGAILYSDTGSLERAAALLAAAVVDIVTPTAASPVRRLEDARAAAELGGFEWLGRLAGSLHLALRRHDSWSDHDAAALARIQPAPALPGDAWGAALTALVVGASRECAGESGTPQLELAASGFAALDALVLQAWARAAAALGEAWRGGSSTVTLVAAAEPVVRRAGAPGPRALLATANAIGAGADRRRDLVAHAHTLATRSGFDPSTLLRATGVPGSPSSGAGPGAVGRHSEPSVALTCFGGFRLSVDAVQVDLSALRPRARTLLRLLALSVDHDVHREIVAESLWPGQQLSSAMRSLQVNVSSLRQALEAAGLSGAEVLPRHGDAYRLALPLGSRADVRDLQGGLRRAAAAAAQGREPEAVALRQGALDLYAGDLLPEDGPAEWVVGERERLRVVVSAAAVEQSRAQAHLGDLPSAIRSAQTSVRLYRFGDQAWELLAELHEAAGNNAEALWTRKEHAKVVAELCAPEARRTDADAGLAGVTDPRSGPRRRGGARALV